MNKMNKMTIIITILVIILLALGFYFFVPIKDSPLSGGPVSPTKPPHKLNKVSLYEYAKLKKVIFNGDIVE
jgi:flagellar basal body-associated protein FliL